MTTQQFIAGFSPANAAIMCMDEARCHIGSGPTIRQATAMHGPQAVATIIETWIADLHRFAGVPMRLTRDQLTDIDVVIMSQYPNMRVAELCLYFIKYKAGQYGKLYQQIYAMDITTPLIGWAQECRAEQNRLLYEQHQARIESWREQGYLPTNNNQDTGHEQED